ncbi:hypothetical protein YW3DRAFT_06467 [Streptomyces sp. MnatMP-M77]|uniref:hypothetical protein n=1 Tax=unclassified Streptomyces TaxID=2593676 RepID=UPI0008051EC8|nr:hypothetical protein [Streptomyces sp. MnatMP-M77]MYT77480.1 hypothetical protein [Streptomyces sp. SID8364]SBU99159.1 hypothetical protein YW3DRAFT_06467 [Streptomyces sp. MnatMP-M77]
MPDPGGEIRETSELSLLEKNSALKEWLRCQLGQVQKRIRDLDGCVGADLGEPSRRVIVAFDNLGG